MATRITFCVHCPSLTLILLLAFSQFFAYGCAQGEEESQNDSLMETINLRAFYWAKVVLDQYNVSVESLDMRMKEVNEFWKAASKFPQDGSTTIHYNYDYSDPLTQATYLRYHLALLVHTHTRIIDQNPELAALFDDKPLLNIVSIGSGPGSDMAGVLNYLLYRYRHLGTDIGSEANSRSTPPMLRFLLTDRVNDWSRAINLLENAIREDEDDQETDEMNIVRFEKLFYQWDLVGNTSKSSGEQVALHQLPSVITGDLFMFSRVLTDILFENGISLLPTAAINIRRLFSSAPDGALFLFVHDAEKQDKLKPFFEEVLFPPGGPSCTKMREYIFEDKMEWNNQAKKYLGKYFTGPSDTVIASRLHVLIVRKVGPQV